MQKGDEWGKENDSPIETPSSEEDSTNEQYVKTELPRARASRASNANVPRLSESSTRDDCKTTDQSLGKSIYDGTPYKQASVFFSGFEIE